MIKKLKGFTLIELLVVIVIIGILASLVLINVNENRKSSRDAKRVSDLKSIQTALEMYYEQNTAYPVSDWADVDSISVSLVPKYLPTLPQDPKQDANYIYKSNGLDYKLKATLETCYDNNCCNSSNPVSIQEICNAIGSNEIAVFSTKDAISD